MVNWVKYQDFLKHLSKTQGNNLSENIYIPANDLPQLTLKSLLEWHSVVRYMIRSPAFMTLFPSWSSSVWQKSRGPFSNHPCLCQMSKTSTMCYLSKIARSRCGIMLSTFANILASGFFTLFPFIIKSIKVQFEN